MGRAWRFAGCAVALIGCHEPDPCPEGNPATLIDSTGAKFALSESCAITPTSDTFSPYDCTLGGPGQSLVWARFVTIGMGCLVFGDLDTGTEAERPVACNGDRDCPTLFGDEYECANGLCQDVDREEFPRDEIEQRDVATMCYGPFDRSETVDIFGSVVMEVQMTVQAACSDGECTLPLPDACLQP